MLKIDGIETSYGNLRVLHGVSLEVKEKEIACVIGPNGAGKTTLLNSICGVIPIQGGSISFLEKPIHRLSPVSIVQAGISQVPEGRRVFGSLSVRDNLILGAYLRYRKTDKSGIGEDLDQVYHMFPILQERQKQNAGSLSGGEQQMLAIGRALMSSPQLLMLDEPSLGLAPKIVGEIFQIVNRLNKRGVTILLVEQNAKIALSLSDHGCVLETGRIALAGKASDLRMDERVKHTYLGS